MTFDAELEESLAEIQALDAILTACDPRRDHDLLRDLARRRVELTDALRPFGVWFPAPERVA